jgi:hypothetical protein
MSFLGTLAWTWTTMTRPGSRSVVYGDTGPWYAQLIHQNYQEQLAWMRQDVDLANYHQQSTPHVGRRDHPTGPQEHRVPFCPGTDCSETRMAGGLTTSRSKPTSSRPTPSASRTTWKAATATGRQRHLGHLHGEGPQRQRLERFAGANYANGSDTFLTLNGMVD